MNLEKQRVGDVCVATIMEENLDASNARDFRDSIAPVLEECQQVIMDLSALQFVDSSGLGALLSALRSLRGRGGELKLCTMTKQVRVLFELVRMHRIFDIYNTREEALQAYETPAGEAQVPAQEG